MFKKVKNIVYLLLFMAFVISTIGFYFSDKNIKKTNKSRSFYSVKLSHDMKNLPLLKNDTANIIEYRNDIEVYKKKKKNYKFWDLIGR